MNKLVFFLIMLFYSKCFSQNLEQIKKADTIYVYFEYNKKNQRHNKEVTTNTKQKYEYYYYIFSGIPNYQSMTFLHHYNSSPEERIEKKSFFKKNKDVVITFEFLTQFDLGEATQLIGNKKKVYLIDKKDFRCGKIKLKEVKVMGVVPNVE